MQQRPQKRPKHGYLYLIQVRDGWPELHKIGITQNPPKRFESLSDDNNGHNRILRVIYVAGYKQKEARLKDFFSNRAYKYEPLRGNGSTEVFNLTWLDLAIVVCSMEWWALMDKTGFRLTWYAIITAATLGILYYLFPWAPGLIIENL